MAKRQTSSWVCKEMVLLGFTRCGRVHLRRTNSRCQRRRVSGVTSEDILSAAGLSRWSTDNTMRSSGRTFWAADLTSENADLLAKYEEFDVLGLGGSAGQQDEPEELTAE